MTEVREANSELQKSVTTQLSLCHLSEAKGKGLGDSSRSLPCEIPKQVRNDITGLRMTESEGAQNDRKRRGSE